MSEETKKKMSLSAKGKPKSEEARKNMSLARKGERVSIKTEFKKGRIVTDEIKRKISEALKGKKPTLESRIKNRDSHLIKNINKTNKVDDSKVWRKKME